MRKVAQQGKGNETVPMSPCTNAEKGADGGEEREWWLDQKAGFWKQDFGLKKPRAL